jgi:hypothetical protein
MRQIGPHFDFLSIKIKLSCLRNNLGIQHVKFLYVSHVYVNQKTEEMHLIQNSIINLHRNFTTKYERRQTIERSQVSSDISQ